MQNGLGKVNTLLTGKNRKRIVNLFNAGSQFYYRFRCYREASWRGAVIVDIVRA